MTDKLFDNLDKALRIIANKENTALRAADVRRLVMNGYIKANVNGGWLVNDKGKIYLKQQLKSA